MRRAIYNPLGGRAVAVAVKQKKLPPAAGLPAFGPRPAGAVKRLYVSRSKSVLHGAFGVGTQGA